MEDNDIRHVSVATIKRDLSHFLITMESRGA